MKKKPLTCCYCIERCRLKRIILFVKLTFFLAALLPVNLMAGEKEVATVPWSQEITIQGTVTDADNNALPGVTILEKGTNNGSISDVNGHYNITVSSPEAVLVFSFIEGFKKKSSFIFINI